MSHRWLLLVCGLVACSDSTSSPTTGNLDVTVAGLPAGAQAAVTVTGAGMTSRTLTASERLSGLTPGSYTVAAANVTNAGTTFVANPSSQAVTVSSASTASVTVNYGSGTAEDVQLRLEVVATGLDNPVFVTSPPGDQRLFVVEQTGRIKIISNGSVLATPFLDLRSRISTGGERGLLSVAFHPSYAMNGFFFVNFTDTRGDTRVERFHVSSNPNVGDPATSTLILGVTQPFANHNGGLVLFGPDSMLYIGMGDGGSGGDPQGNGQNRNALLGKMLRIDVNGALPYAVPPSNPFVGQSGVRPEIWALGLRNPWRFSFDRATKQLYIADVGQGVREEINVANATQGGLNYGWNTMEGTACYGASTCSQSGLVLPVVDYTHSDGCSVTGGYVYRGSRLPEIAGRYFYTDYCSGWLRSFRFVNGAATSSREWDVPRLASPTSFGEDASGELYIAVAGGTVYRLARR